MKVALEENVNIFVVHVAVLEAPESIMSIEPFWLPLLATLQQKKTLSEISRDYKKYTNVFSTDLVIKLPENMGMNEHVINLVESKQLLYRSIYNLSLVKLETLKMYIKTHLKTRFI